MKAIILRLDAPIMSFGGVMVDHHGVIERFPGVSLLTGLLANAMGWNHGDFDCLQALQSRIIHAARWDVPPHRFVDYHTVDLEQPKMKNKGWTTRGFPEHREGGRDAKFGTHQRYRHYWADGILTVALTLRAGKPPVEDMETALRYPARPLFLGRKTCLPARPLLDPKTPILEGENILAILNQTEVWGRDGKPVHDDKKREASWPGDSPQSRQETVRRVYDLREWANQIPAGDRWRIEGLLPKDQI